MPTTRAPSSACMASVIIPAGLVKLMTYAPGATRATLRGDLERDRDGPQP